MVTRRTRTARPEKANTSLHTPGPDEVRSKEGTNPIQAEMLARPATIPLADASSSFQFLKSKSLARRLTGSSLAPCSCYLRPRPRYFNPRRLTHLLLQEEKSLWRQ